MGICQNSKCVVAISASVVEGDQMIGFIGCGNPDHGPASCLHTNIESGQFQRQCTCTCGNCLRGEKHTENDSVDHWNRLLGNPAVLRTTAPFPGSGSVTAKAAVSLSGFCSCPRIGVAVPWGINQGTAFTQNRGRSAQISARTSICGCKLTHYRKSALLESPCPQPLPLRHAPIRCRPDPSHRRR